MSHRPAQVASLIERYASEFIRRHLEIPPGVIVSVSRVVIGPDLKFAKIYVSILPEDRREEILQHLMQNRLALQQALARRLTMKFAPKIGFALDTTASQAERIEGLLDKIQINDKYQSQNTK